MQPAATPLDLQEADQHSPPFANDMFVVMNQQLYGPDIYELANCEVCGCANSKVPSCPAHYLKDSFEKSAQFFEAHGNILVPHVNQQQVVCTQEAK